ncbi:MAG: CPBP family intramembrane glutamic endopeptidase [Acidobacteriota bacterium]
MLLIFLLAERPWAFLKDLGMTLGDHRLGLLLLAIGVPVAIAFGLIGSCDKALRRYYPLSKAACRSLKALVIFEAAYLFLYYSSWEFFYRGVLFFPLLSAFGLIPALTVQTIISTLHHWGHPRSEILGSLVGGIALGLVAYGTGSFLYGIFLHALTGISTDTLICRREYRKA